MTLLFLKFYLRGGEAQRPIGLKIRSLPQLFPTAYRLSNNTKLGASLMGQGQSLRAVVTMAQVCDISWK